MRFAIGDSTELSGEAVSFKSNALKMPVDGAADVDAVPRVGVIYGLRVAPGGVAGGRGGGRFDQSVAHGQASLVRLM